MAVPLVSVVMPAYNAEQYLEAAVDSILNQTFRDFEFMIIDDGSTDHTPNMLARYAQTDTRIQIYTHATNAGLVASLNEGCQRAQGTYIAMMHADDTSLPDRLTKQVEYAEAHPNIGVLGTGMVIMNQYGELGQRVPVPDLPGLVGWSLLFFCPMVHPSVLLRKAALASLGFYREESYGAEDYDLWARAILITQLANLNEPLIRYRQWPENVSTRRRLQIDEITLRIVRENLSALLGKAVSAEAVMRLRSLWNAEWGARPNTAEAIRATADLLRDAHRVYLVRAKPTRAERRRISRDMALRLAVLTKEAARYSVWQPFRLGMEALRRSPLSLVNLPIFLARHLTKRAPRGKSATTTPHA